MTYRRKKNILRQLAQGGIINKNGSKYSLHHPGLGAKPLKIEEALELLKDGYLTPISWGNVGFVWALRPDLIAFNYKD